MKILVLTDAIQTNKMDILEGLNEQQKEAVLHTKGPLLVVAGAGSGKTKVIAHRIAHLISSGVNPEKILAITFTNKAAKEMKERILKLLSLQVSSVKFQAPFISTFHSLGVYILREDGEKIGISRHFSILDENDSLKIIKESLNELGLNIQSFQPSRLKSFISMQKNNLISYEEFKEDATEYFLKITANVWDLYEKKLKEHKALDFDDLIVKTVNLFKQCPEILEKYRDKWEFVHIDEYQDTNRGQYILARLLAEAKGNICVVGDADQAIYSWRGADFSNILRFEKDWQNSKIITLETNYRSTQNILNAANASISFNKIRIPKNLRSAGNSSGDLPLLYIAENEIDEGEFAANMIKNSLDDKLSTAVLLRTNFQSRIFEEIFLKHDIPHEVIGVKFFERAEIKNILAFVKFSLNRNDFLSFKRIAETMPSGIGEKTLLKYFKKERIPSAEKQNKILEFEKLADEIKIMADTTSPSLLFKNIFKKSGYEDYLESLGEEGQIRTENIKELVSLAKKYEDLTRPEGVIKMLDDCALTSDQDNLKEYGKSVKIITIHAAKGLEFDTVFVAGLEDGLFPYSSFNDQNKAAKLEEERRLFYVSLTRAKKNLFLSYAKTRVVFGDKKVNKPSRFLSEITNDIIIV